MRNQRAYSLTAVARRLHTFAPDPAVRKVPDSQRNAAKQHSPYHRDMCGRDTFFATWEQVRAFSLPLPVATPEQAPVASYNRAPTQPGWVLLPTARGAQIASMRWGLIPFWAKDAKLAYSTINARIETASSKPAFRDPWKRRRCLVPSSGYYEWQLLTDGKTRQPWFVHAADAPLLMFGGLWERWRGPEGEIDSYSIVTQPALGPITQVHDRMPLILPPALFADWLAGDGEAASAVAAQAPVPALAFHRVGSAVGNVRQQGETLIREVPAAAAAGDAAQGLFGPPTTE